jgi:thioredoxin 1
MSEKLLQPNKEEFDRLLASEKLLLVDFWAAWCGPCRMLAPVIEELAEQYSDKVTVAKVNVDEEKELAARYGIQTIPTVILFKDGQPVAKEIGVQPAAAFGRMIDKSAI